MLFRNPDRNVLTVVSPLHHTLLQGLGGILFPQGGGQGVWFLLLELKGSENLRAHSKMVRLLVHSLGTLDLVVDPADCEETQAHAWKGLCPMASHN